MLRTSFTFAALVGCLLADASSVRAQGFVESVVPPVVERGKTTRITFHGRNLGTGLDVWHSLPAGAITAMPVESHADRLVFDITAAPNAPIGTCGLRIATRDGLTNAVLFLVDDLPVKPRPSGENPMSLARPAAVWGSLRAATVDRYRLDVTAGERVSFEVVANRFGKDADPLLTIRDAAGKWIADHDNDPGLYFDFRFEHRFEKAGTYTIELRDARFEGSEHHRYVLRIGKFPTGRVALPSAVVAGRNELRLPEVPDATFPLDADPSRLPGPFFAALKRPGDDGSTWVPLATSDTPVTVARDPDATKEAAFVQATSPALWFAYWLSPQRANPFLTTDALLSTGRVQATPATVPGTLCGVLRKPGQRGAFLFRLEKGQRIFVKGEAKSLNSPADIEVSLTDRTGRELRRGSTLKDEVTLDFTAGTAGDYGLIVRDELRDGGDAFAYRLDVRVDPFPPQITAEVEGLSVPRGTFQTVPITVTRNGFAGPIALKVLGAPAGLRLTPDTIAETESAVVCKLEADASAPLGVHTLQLVAEIGSEGHPQRVVVTTRPLIDRKYQNVDLIPLALREDQTRLPPSLTDRFAVQITPPSPFTFELPEAVATLPRYQTVPIPVTTTRVPSFDGPITFTAVGGQLSPKEEGRTRVYAEFPAATVATPKISGVVVSKILSNLAKNRIDVTATGTHQGRRVVLTRTFELDLRAAFRITADPPKLDLKLGETATVRFVVDRVPSFTGAVTLELPPSFVGISPLPETLTIPANRSDVSLTITAASDAAPRRQGLQIRSIGTVGGYEEEVRSQPVEIDILKPPPAPKKK